MMSAPAPSPQANFGFLFNPRQPWIMGVLNATPDSFYGESRANGVSALPTLDRLIAEGADILDVGGESTRPGGQPVSSSEELARVLPVLKAAHARRPNLLLSIDTQKADVARQALAAGARMVNDVSALRGDPDMVGVVAEAKVPVVLMHRQGTASTMQDNPQYGDVVADVKSFLEERLAFAVRSGVAESCVILDPGIGFGKTVEHNLMILRRLRELVSLGRPIVIGLSRKSFLGRFAPDSAVNVLPPEERLEGSLAAGLWSLERGAQGLRVHDVQSTRRAVAVWNAIKGNDAIGHS